MAVHQRADELVLVNVDCLCAEGEAWDSQHGLPFSEPLQIRWGNTRRQLMPRWWSSQQERAGDSTKVSRLVLLQKNAAIVRSIAQALAPLCPEAVSVVVTNLVDVIAYWA
ncbi:MAG: hypothetical protein NZ821_09635 [Gloeomargarita sp. SKYB31]|nr:hypothetical protein [Gloeomargarita sp. SKYB31]